MFDKITGELAIVNADNIGSLVFRDYSSVGSLKSGAGFIMGTGIKPHPTIDNAVKKTTGDNGSMIYFRYDRGMEIHTGLTGAADTVIYDTDNIRMTINNSGNVFFSSL